MQELLAKIVKSYGTPCFVYFFDQVIRRIAEINDAFNNRFQISYAIKANPNPALVSRLMDKISFLDVSSLGEIELALKAGWSGNKISFTGPGKRDSDLSFALQSQIGEIVLESVFEAERLNTLAIDRGQQQPVLIRIAPTRIPPGFGGHMAGRPCAFGIDEEDLQESIKRITSLEGLELVGFHIFSGTQCLNSKAITDNWTIFTDVFKKATEISGIKPQKLIFGSGMGIPYHEKDQALLLPEIASKANSLLDELKSQPAFSKTVMVLEMGRFLIGEAGIYLTQVVNRKISRGTKICICDGGMNHNLAACGLMGMVLPQNYRFIKIDNGKEKEDYQDFQIGGPLCTALDTFGRNVKLPGLNVGDVIGILSTGAYGLTASPIYFISHQTPKEIIIEEKDPGIIIEDISRF